MRPGDVGSIPIECANFDGPLSLDYRQKRPRAAIRFKSCATGQLVDDPTRLLSVVQFIGPNVVRLSNSMVEFRPCAGVAGSTPASDAISCPIAFQFSTGRRIGLSPIKRVVAGSTPAFGSRCRSSSVVEHVNSQFDLYPSLLWSAGLRPGMFDWST